MKLGILTSGGDAPGMNAAIRTVVVVGASRGHEVVGIRSGYVGLLDGDAVTLTPESVEGISRYGGTMLGSARSKIFPSPAGQERARQKVADLGLDALVVIGGNGSLTGAHVLGERRPSSTQRKACTIVGIPASIDNDVGHTGLAIGVDTAVNTIVEACDRISDTARAHRRAFIVEVMGRHCGFLAMRAGIAAEADAIVYGEDGKASEDELVERLSKVLLRAFVTGNKKRCLIIKAEGVAVPTKTLTTRLQEMLDREVPGVGVRETVLGHVVRGGNPSALDRVVAQRLAFGAINACEAGKHDVMAGWDVPGNHGEATADSYVRLVSLADMIKESASLIDGTSPVVKRRLALLKKVQDVMSL